MSVLELDYETYSSVELKKTNVYAYVESPDFTALMCAWRLDGSPVRVATDLDDILSIPGLRDDSVLKVAHNAGFERVVTSRLLGLPVGRYLDPECWDDTAARAALHGMPRDLARIAVLLGVTPKESAGTRLINIFSKPNRQGRRTLPEERPEQWVDFMDYCAQDVDTLHEVNAVLPGWTGIERAVWLADQRVNDRGMRVDLAMARKAVKAAEENDERARREVIKITGVENPGSTMQLGTWCAGQGLEMPNWQKETVADTLMDGGLPEDIERVLRLRQELALVSSNKFKAALRGVSSDGRLRGQFVYCGAHTARWSAKGVQLHNLAKKGFVDKDGESDVVLQECAILDLMYDMGMSPEGLKKLVRPLFVGPYAIADYSAIEARVLAWLAGEQWVLDAVQEGRDLYVETAERMGGGMGRPEGKIAVLAAGYQGSVGSLRNMGYGGRRCPFDRPIISSAQDPLTGQAYAAMADALTVPEAANPDAVASFLRRARRKRLHRDEVREAIAGHVAERERDPEHRCDVDVKAVVDAWREANPSIREFWYDLERKFWNGGIVAGGRVRVRLAGNARKIYLPSGRALNYRQVARRPASTRDPETGEVRTKNQITYLHVQGYREKTYGGRLTENVTQAVARDLLAYALVNLDKADVPVVAHVHDEVVVDNGDPEQVKALMEDLPAWAKGLPVVASADVSERYTK